ADWPAEVRARVRDLGLTPEREADVVDELAHHLAEREIELRAQGLGADDARRQTLADIADEPRLRAELRRLRQARRSAQPPPAAMPHRSAMASVWQDVRYGVRALVQRPAFTIAALTALTVGIGSTAAIFGAVDTVLLRPMPFTHADRLYVPVGVKPSANIDQ